MTTMPQPCSRLEHAFLRCSMLAPVPLRAAAWGCLPRDVNMISVRVKFEKKRLNVRMSDSENLQNLKIPIEVSTRD